MPDNEEYLAFSFESITDFCPNGVFLSRDILVATEKRADEAYDHAKASDRIVTVPFQNLFGDNVMIELDPKVTYHWNLQGLFNMADEDPEFSTNDPSRYNPAWLVNSPTDDKQGNPINLKEISICKKQWEDSWQSQDLTRYLTNNVKNMVQVTKIVCFGLGTISDAMGPQMTRSYIQHEAACTIAKALRGGQTVTGENSNDIAIYGQDPEYTASDKVLLRNMDPPITVVEGKNFIGLEGFKLVDSNTIIVAISATCRAAEISIQLAGAEGPAGMLHDKMQNMQTEWTGKKRKGDQVGFSSVWATNKMWMYRDSCMKFDFTDEEWFGLEHEDGRFDTELLLRKRIP